MLRQQALAKALVAALIGCSVGSFAFGQVSVEVAEHEEYGAHLVTGDGLSLYVFLEDADVEGSACGASCAAAWPPLTTEGEVNAGEGVDDELLSTTERSDGTLQVTYDGWPLHRYLVDRNPGQAAGQGQGDEWYLLAPDGTVIGADLESAAEEASGAAGDEPAAAEEEIDVAALMEEGSRIYSSMCAGCHGPNGDQVLASHVVRITEAEGTVSNGPALIRQIMYGGAYMPAFGGSLSNEQMQAIATYVRNSFGHDFGPVTQEEVIMERERFD